MARVTDEKFREALENNTTAAGVLRELGLTPSGTAYRACARRARRLGLGTSLFKVEEGGGKPLEKWQRKRTLDALGRVCCNCGVGCEWKGQPLTLQVDHINGDRYDHRLENLRVLCPNCHSQTNTWGTKRREPKAPNTCSVCGDLIHDTSKMCKPCALRQPRKRIHKIEWPTDAELRALVWAHPLIQVGTMLGVSGQSVRKRCDLRSIERPPMGWWASNKSE